MRDDEVDITDWPDCAVDGCPNKTCRVLNSPYCFPHTPGNKWVKHMKIDAMSDDPIIFEPFRRSFAKAMDRVFAVALFGSGPVYSNAVPQPNDEGLTLEKVLAAAEAAGSALTRSTLRDDGRLSYSLIPAPRSFDSGASFGGLQIEVKDAQEQARTPRDVRGPWARPGRVPSKCAGRKGTRRAWKRAHPPGWTWLYREPEDVLVLNGRSAWVTPRQWDGLKRMTTPL
jgi:hypothetical protein